VNLAANAPLLCASKLAQTEKIAAMLAQDLVGQDGKVPIECMADGGKEFERNRSWI
jgi:hypothetical protein